MAKSIRPTELSEWVFFGKAGTFSGLLGGDISYINKIRSANRPVICITVITRGKWRWQLELDTVEGFRNTNVTTSEKGKELITNWFLNETYRHPRRACLIGPNYWSARFNNLDYVVKAANSLAELSSDCFVPDSYNPLRTEFCKTEEDLNLLLDF